MSAIGNDYGYEQVFARELRALANPRDVFIPISTSGNSPNILAAVEVAREISLRTIGFTGVRGGRVAEMCPCLRVPSGRTERVQEGHILLGHILCGLVESAYFRAHQPELTTTA
jgi:D-sedoheptulose 7-phosphate isomerase